MGQMNDPKIFRLTGDYENPNYMIDDVPMLTANPMSDRLPLVFDADPSSRASAASTSALNEPATPSSGSARRMSGDEASSPPTGPASSAAPTWLGYDDLNQAMTGEIVAPLRSGGDGGLPNQLICSVEASPAKTSASPADEPDSAEPGAASSSSSCESQMSLLDPEDGALSRMCRVYSVQMEDGTWLPSSGRWPTSGSGIWPTEFWTHATSESPNAGAVSTSLRDVLEASVPARYFLSPKAAAGILRRAAKRGRELPSHLSAALAAVARTTTTDKQDAS